MKWSVTTPPTSTKVLDLETVKLHVRLTDVESDETVYLNRLIDTAYAYAEQALETSLQTQTITAIYYTDDPARVVLPRGPVQSIVSVKDSNGASVSSVNYELRAFGNVDYVILNTGPVRPLTVVYTAGLTSVPADIYHAMLTHVATLYAQRESISDGGLIAVPHSLESFYSLKSRGNKLG